ncbi:fimbrial protein [Entomohabitans teleogrylli]|uniref:fimbrial protein n=1 Tax=Entomohabitans teleogrylli TaxID=1384589 RepID=UPI00073D4FE6|nr:fimbrial protein [Entomohabitans teleogrylli]
MNVSKRVFLSAMLSSLLVSGSVLAVDSGVISFSGTITDTTCEVNIGGTGTDAAVVLPAVSAESLKGATKTNGKTRFTLSLSGCSTGLSSAKAFFAAGTSVDDATGRLKNMDTTDSGAGNISLQLRDGQNDSVIVAGDQSQINSTAGYVDVTSASATLPYFVEYYSEGVVTPGTVTSQVTYNLIYK